MYFLPSKEKPKASEVKMVEFLEQQGFHIACQNIEIHSSPHFTNRPIGEIDAIGSFNGQNYLIEFKKTSPKRYLQSHLNAINQLKKQQQAFLNDKLYQFHGSILLINININEYTIWRLKTFSNSVLNEVPPPLGWHYAIKKDGETLRKMNKKDFARTDIGEFLLNLMKTQNNKMQASLTKE